MGVSDLRTVRMFVSKLLLSDSFVYAKLLFSLCIYKLQKKTKQLFIFEFQTQEHFKEIKK